MTDWQATAAWETAKAYAREWGTRRLLPDAPQLPAKIEYALRRIGGLAALDEEREQFIAAYNEAPEVDE